MKKYLVTFGLGTIYARGCVILTAEDEDTVRAYAYKKYGQMNVATVRDYNDYAYLIDKYEYIIYEDTEL